MSETKTEVLSSEILADTSIIKMCGLVNDEMKTFKPTHIATAITYGADAHIEFQEV